MNEIRNEFFWSKSRDEVFQTCPRQYFFNYYGYWGGWEKIAPERTRQIYILKKLKNRQMWLGEKVHDCIKHISFPTLRFTSVGLLPRSCPLYFKVLPIIFQFTFLPVLYIYNISLFQSYNNQTINL